MIDAINILYYVLIFIMGTVFGSFFTLAVYRLPLHKDITHERSFCPNCNHRLEFLDLIPIWSYIFLRGKCRYCGKKIRPRYLILEVLSGTVFLVAYLSYKINIVDLSINGVSNYLPQIISSALFILTYISFVIMGFIDREHHIIHWGTYIFGLISVVIYFILIFLLKMSISYQLIITSLGFLLIGIYGLINKNQKIKIPFGFYISLLSVIMIIICNYIL